MFKIMKRTQGGPWDQVGYASHETLAARMLKQEICSEDGVLSADGLSGEFEQNGQLVEIKIGRM